MVMLDAVTLDQLRPLWRPISPWAHLHRSWPAHSLLVYARYDLTFPVRDPNAPPNAQPLPNNKDQGILKYAMPDKGVYHIIYTDRNGKWESAPPERIEHWICDGKSVYEYKYPTDPKKPGQVLEHPLPPEMKGKAIADGPLPFLFGAEAAKLRLRYYLRIITPADVQNEVWLEAYPKLPQDAANFSRAILCLNLPDMLPKALRLFLPGGKNYNSYQFFDIVINDKLRIFKGDPFQAFTPPGWQKITDPSPPQNAPSTQAARPLAPAR
jgi:TIGR03009 family protein